MKASEIIMIIAVLLAPLFAVQVQKVLEAIRERTARKLLVFQTLMATRAWMSRVSPTHVQALNSIDIEFYGHKWFVVRRQSRKEKAVINTWRMYLDHLNSQCPPERRDFWFEKGDELLTDLLFTMSQALGYDFEKVQLKRGIYAPIRHTEDELASREIRNLVLSVLRGELAIPVNNIREPVDEVTSAMQSDVQKALLEHLKGGSAVRVRIERSNS